MNTKHHYRALLLGAASAILSWNAPAQQAAAPAKGAGLEEIVVTARKTTESIQDAPLSVVVLNAEKMTTASITKVEEHQKWQDEMDKVAGIGEVIIGKQRHGPTGTVRLQFTGEFTRFADLADDARLPARF